MRDPTYIYFIKCGDFVKIGKAKDVAARMKDLQIGNPYPLELLITIKEDFISEKDVHKFLIEKNQQHQGEWFYYGEEIISFIDLIKKYDNCIEEIKERLHLTYS